MQRSFTFALLLVVCLVLLVGPVAAQDAPTPEPVGLRPDAPPYAVHGPYWVGVTDYTLDEDTDHPIPLTVWYPAENPEGQAEDTTYNWLMKWVPMPDMGYIVRGRALRDAPPDLADGPYPLVVFSEGFAVSAATYAYLLEHLASQGFVVVAPEHTEYFYTQAENPWNERSISVAARPGDITRTIDAAEQFQSEAGALQGMIDLDHVALVGHSMGSLTALETAGAQLNTASYNPLCPEAMAMPAAVCDEMLQGIADLRGLDELPDALWPSVADARIDAIVPMSGDGWLLGEAGLASVTVPTLAMGGTADTMTRYDLGVPVIYANVGSSQKAMVGFEAGDHFMFQTPCEDATWLPAFGAGFFCSDSVWDMDRAHDLINHFTAAFLLSTLKGDAEATAALSPDTVAFPGIEYRAEGF
jgi:predicted dienelactone hydrolase